MSTDSKNTMLAALAGLLLTACDGNPWSWWHDGSSGPGQGGVCSGHGELVRGRCVCESGYHPSKLGRKCEPDAQPSSDERLVVADANEKRLYVIDVNTFETITELQNIEMADHPGFLPLGDGRLLFVDSASNTLQIARIAGVDKPVVEDAIPLLGRAAHIAIDPSAQHAVVSASDAYEDGRGAFTIVDLDDGSYSHVPVSTGEPGLALTSAPVHVIHRNDAPPQLEMYLLDELKEGITDPLHIARIGAAPHGEVIAQGLGKIVSAAADGINLLPYSEAGFGDVNVLPYAVDGLSGGRAFYARISGDGRFMYSYLRDDKAGTAPWGDWRSDAYVVDLQNETAKRVPIGNGLVYRLGVCPRMAAFTQYAPEGDATYLMDADPSSPTFQTLVARVELERMSLAPGADGDIWSSQAFRITAMSSDCRYVFVTHGGDGKISVINTSTKRVERVLRLPTKLVHGGYLVSMRSKQPVVDTIGR